MARAKRRVRQHEIEFRAWGGARAGAGRKRQGGRSRVSHRARPAVEERHPLHITVRLRAGLPNLRRGATREVLERTFARGAERFGLRLVQYAILSNHLHLVVEAQDRRALARGMQGLLVRAAKALNRHWGRKGRVVADHFHARSLRTPREVRSALAYVLQNARRHGLQLRGTDPFTSGAWFDGWAQPTPAAARASPCAPARTWLLRAGWRRHGTISRCETPQPARAARATGWQRDARKRRIAAGGDER